MHYYFIFQIAVLDVDICGPSIPKVMGLEGEQVRFLLQDTVVDVRQFGGGGRGGGGLCGSYTSSDCTLVRRAGCKEGHFYSLPFGQVEANIY